MNFFNILKSLKSGFFEIISEAELLFILEKKNDLVIKIGFDPTSTKLHLGHVVLLKKLRLFQDYGYKISVVIGDFTAMIGDPSGKNESRKQIDKSEVFSNLKTYNNQIFKILNPDLTNIFFNSSWLKFLDVNNIIDLMSNVTISRLFERNDFKSRYFSNKSIYLHEFFYPILQSYDSIFLNSDIEFGGIDQKFNFLFTRDLQKRFGLFQQVLLMSPILRGLDGKNKMSKSLNNCINIDDDFYDIFCKVMSIPDSLIEEYYVFLGFFSLDEYNNFLSINSNHFMNVKIDLAFKIVSLFYDNIYALKAKEMFLNHFSKKNSFEDISIKYFNIKSSTCLLSDFLVLNGFISSYSEFKRLLKQSAIKLNKNVVTDRNFFLNVNFCYFLQLGKKKFFNIFLKN